MEKLKTRKALGFIAVLVAFVLMLGVVGYVVYAAVSKDFNFGGKVSFEADGVNATVEATTWTGCTINGFSDTTEDTGSATLQTFSYSTTKNNDTSSKSSTWQNLEVVITDASGVASLTFAVTNDFTDSTAISATIGNISGTSDDLSIEVDPTYITINAGETETFVITFTVDSNHDLNETTFNIPISLAVLEPYTVTVKMYNYCYSASGWEDFYVAVNDTVVVYADSTYDSGSDGYGTYTTTLSGSNKISFYAYNWSSEETISAQAHTAVTFTISDGTNEYEIDDSSSEVSKKLNFTVTSDVTFTITI